MRPASLLLPGLLLVLSCTRPEGMETLRSLDAFRLDQIPAYPGGLPAAWAHDFDAALVAAAPVDPGAPGVLAQIRSTFLSIPWIDPKHLVVEAALPEGFRVRYRPRVPRLVLTRGERTVGVLSKDGVLLPPGLQDSQLVGLIRTPVPPTRELPGVGERPADGDLQEAQLLCEVAETIRDLLELPIVTIARQSDYPASADRIAPAMSFYLADGTEIRWGRAEGTRDAFSVDERGRPLTLERKFQRLKAVWQQYPGLVGLGRVVLDFPQVHLYDEAERELPLPASWRR